MKETENIEVKLCWRDEYLKTIAAFANTQGGKLILGIGDDGQIIGVLKPEKLLEDIPNKITNHLRIYANELLTEKEGKTIIEIITSKHQMPVSYHGRYYIRSGSTTQEITGNALQELLLRASNLTWDEVTIPMASWNDFDLQTIKRFAQQAIQNNHIPRDIDLNNHKKLFENLKLIRKNEFTRASVLLFAKEPTRFFSAANCKIGRFGGNDPTDLISDNLIEDNLFNMPDRIMELLHSKYLPSQYYYKGLHRLQKFAIPEKALREAVLNAIIHRNYNGLASIMIRVYDNKLSIWNDGSLIAPLSVEMLKEEHPSLLRNRLIANIFYFAGYIEAWGRGTLSIIKQLAHAGLPGPDFIIKGGGFEIAFQYEPFNDPINDPINVLINDPISDRVKLVLQFIKNNKYITLQEMALKCNVSIKTIKRDIDFLKSNAILSRKGSRKTGYWEITETGKDDAPLAPQDSSQTK